MVRLNRGWGMVDSAGAGSAAIHPFCVDTDYNTRGGLVHGRLNRGNQTPRLMW